MLLHSIVHSSLSSIYPREKKEHFGDVGSASFTYALASVLTFAIVIIILGFAGVFLWNYVIAGKGDSPGLITIAKPATSIWQIIGIYLLMILFKP